MQRDPNGNQGVPLERVVFNDGKTDPIVEMEAFDKLPPLTRKAIAEFPLEFSAELTLNLIRKQNVSDIKISNQIKENSKLVIKEMTRINETMPILADKIKDGIMKHTNVNFGEIS